LAFSGRKAQRTCLGCRKAQDQDLLVRYVLTPQGEIVVDYRRKLPGRGAYTCIDPSCVASAVKQKQFQRAFKSEILSPQGDALVKSLELQIETRILNLVGMARKAGKVATGGNLVLGALRVPGELALVLLARDVSSGIADKVLAKAEVAGVPCFSLSDKGRLGQITGKGERSVVGLRPGQLGDSLKGELLRYKYIVGES